MKIYLEAESGVTLLEIIGMIKKEKINVQDMEKSESDVLTPDGVSLTVTMILPRGYERQRIIKEMKAHEGITMVEEL